jgi:hypothetical protein
MKKVKLISKISTIVLVFTVLVVMLGGLVNTTYAQSEKTTINVMDGSPWFTKGSYSGHPEYWWLHYYSGFYYYTTYVGGMSWLGGSPTQADAWARFTPYLSQSGVYDVYTYFFACPDTSTQVPFWVYHNSGVTKVTVNQYSSYNDWKLQYLGRWSFSAGSYSGVLVLDNTGEYYDGVTGLSVGTVLFVRVNQLPTAYIDSITPNPATQGAHTVSFTGHGTDSDGSVNGYNWRSSRDGQLSTSSSFSRSASSLSVGTHTIYFKVKDDDDAWSPEVSTTLTINAAPTPTGSISVDSNLSGAGFTLDGPSGVSAITPYSDDNAGAGTYTVTWFPISGHTTPQPEEKNLTAGGSISFYGDYQTEIPVPQITSIDPNQPVAQSTRQWLGILGTGFVSESQVILRIGSSEYHIPSDRTQFLSSTRINVFVGLSDPGTWTAQVVNPDDLTSNIFSFTVAPQHRGNLAAATRAALMFWEPDIAVTMLAIAGAESGGWKLDAAGDSPSILRSKGYPGSAATAKTYNCPLGTEDGYASWGLWQIFMPLHKSTLESLGAPKDDPCATAEWLKDPANNARAAFAVWQSQGFGAWTMYNNGEYDNYLAEAQQAVEETIIEAYIHSPGELRIYDSMGRVTGLVEGELREEIPNSLCTGEGVAILNANDSYYYEVVGTDEGTYGLNIFMVRDGDVDTLTLRGAPTTDRAVHHYTIDWEALALSNPGVTIEKDYDGDGQIDERILTGVLQTPADPSPIDNATQISLNTILSWTGDDNDSASYNIYFGTDINAPLVSEKQVETTYVPVLEPNTIYYWYVAAVNEHNLVSEGPVWVFATGEEGIPFPCFIATAAYGTPMEKEVQILRTFRDEYLLTNHLGQAFVNLYYSVSPPIAKFITDHPALKPIVRTGLLPAVVMCTVVVNTTATEKVVTLSILVPVSLAVVIWVIKRRRKGLEYN